MLKTLFLIFVILSFTTQCYAENAPTNMPKDSTDESIAAFLGQRLLPEYLPCTYNNERYACYNKDQQQELLKLEVNARTWGIQANSYKLALQSKYLEANLINAQLTLITESLTVATQLVDRQAKELDQAIKEKNDWRAEAETPVIWPYIVGGIVGVLGLGFGLGASLFN